MTRYCSICGNLLTPDEEDICNNCQESFLIKDDILPDIKDFAS
jgi:hypothetical protein